MADEVQQAMTGDRRAMARMLSAIENGSVAAQDMLPETSSIETGLGNHGHHRRPRCRKIRAR